MTQQALRFDGATFDADLDGERLTSQLERVKAALSNGEWWTPRQLVRYAGGDTSSTTARCRDLRKAQFGGHKIKSRRIKGGNGAWEYRWEQGK